jgi:hypothetical protein
MTYQTNVQKLLVNYLHRMGFMAFGVSGLFNTDAYIKILIFHIQVPVIYDK